ncbi:endoribonuclease Dcr-2 [Stomoxys calcitrans]|uniref:ribonuclease III n=1 Tax=Stomoxys calcitrans TaxID=35570 RepID=A0A1I8PVX8_STOCA|nr:endoribonuclease Dcr-2 [Stomoxys calcitrans]XP_059224986.1 endoribonuclease Dcr-2 [Stomoxys calcitrans]XP_059224987.1 endoribonuclease Dcr-2 [Stomoxys calcitrans]XP_059224988.1 endoribonuclease Dcr-2 [Stomoxys calcitrans]XP_059224989.1 endoribonuclease Dcr-2 [Stomoxys calcitrans]
METHEEVKAELIPRPYQLDLVDYVHQRNGIIYLPTGAGKTFVAILALKRFAHTLQETIENGGKRAIFMCNTVELARQQFKELQKSTNLKIGLYIGDRDVDNWERRKWQSEIRERQVLVGTAQIFVDIVTQNFIKISDLSIVVIDECHHASGGHPMKTFLSTFPQDPKQGPRVIGLTGVLIKGNKLGNVVEDLRILESTMRGNIITVRSMEAMQNVMVYSTKPSEEFVMFNSSRHIFGVEEKIKRLVEECAVIIKNWNIGLIPTQMSKNLGQTRQPNKKKLAINLLNDFIYQMDDLGLYAASIAIMSPIIDFEVKKRQSETLALRNLYRMIISYCERIRHIIVKELKDMVESNGDSMVEDKDIKCLDVIMNYASPKLITLIQYITSKFQGKAANDIACLIFVERRYTAKCLFHILLRYVALCPGLKDIVRPQFMVGRQNILPSVESILETKWNSSAIKEFRAKECNVIICSNVLEEGIDVQACNYVFTFDPLKTFNSYIQTKGRARSQNSTYTIFAPDTAKEHTLAQIRKYRMIHEQIKSFLISRVLDREDPSAEEIAEQFVDLIPPYVIPSGARLLANSALALLHRYCQSLPWDSFGACQPWYNKMPPNGENKIAVMLTLPLQSSVKEIIISDYMDTAKEAKISAAFKACVKLYQNGELNDFLLPITKSECIAKLSDSLFEHWKNFDDNVCSKTVGKQLRRLYDRKCPDELYHALPKLGESCYAYTLEFIPEFQVNDYNVHIDKNLKTKSTYALLLSKKLPKLAEMPLFMTQGELRVKISEAPIRVVIETNEQLQQLKQFHSMIFRDILNLWREFLVLDNRNMEYAYLIVPLNENHAIDWPLVQTFPQLQPNKPKSFDERQSVLRYNPSDYLDKVVTKWYSDRESERFIVTKIRGDLNPVSKFDGNNYDTYVTFYESRYGVQIVNRSQFLLEVKALTHRRNFFNNASNKSSEKKKETNRIILVPELCHNYHYPGNMWLKALFLPTILHRLEYMLHAENLRLRINQFLGLDRYFGNYTPKPLMKDLSLKRVLDDDGNLIKPKENTKLLSSLPAKNTTEPPYEVLKLDAEDIHWKPYLQPIDLHRKLEESYCVEVDYYSKIFSNLVIKFDDLKLKEEEELTKSQLDVKVSKRREPPTYSSTVSENLPSQFQPLAIKDTPRDERTRIHILQKNIDPDHILQSAEQYELLAAITTAGANDIFDMERFEMLGDAFLKFSVSLYLANKYGNWNEGFLTIVKGRLVSNRNLLYCLLGTDICQRICNMAFKPNTAWLPPMCSLPANLLELLAQYLPKNSTLEPADLYKLQLTESEKSSGLCSPTKLEYFVQACNKNKDLIAGQFTMPLESDVNLYLYKEVVRDKIVADTLEAILGVCVKNYGIHRSFRMLEFFGICTSERDNPLTNLLDLKLGSQQYRTDISSSKINDFLVNADILEHNLGYKFKDRAYLLQALTHPSYPTNRLTGCYQELEFIGDAILDMLITCYIFERYQYMDPGKMTDLRSALVNNITLGCICVRYRFHLFLLYENALLAEAIKIFADFQDTQNHVVSDQVKILMEENTDEVDPYSVYLHGYDDDEGDEDDNVDDCMHQESDDEHNASNWPTNKKPSFNMATKIDVPKALGDIVEAIIGAIYLDCRDLEKTWQVIFNLFENELNEFSRNVPIDPVRQLGEMKHANPKYSKPLVDNDVVMVKCTFYCLDRSCTTHGFGSNAVLAKKAAAKQALQIFAKNSN